MIDLHCHILPGVDDGPLALAESLKMAEKAVADGICGIVATPHATNRLCCCSPAEIGGRVDAFKNDLAAAAIPLQVYPGAELQLGPGLVEQLQQKRLATMNNSRYVLLEMPPTILQDPCRNELFRMLNRGYIPLIAHPERHPYLQRDQAYLAELVRLGALCQVTAQSLLGIFGRSARDTAVQMLRNRLVHVLATDAHSAVGRVPALIDAVAVAARLLGSAEKAKQLVDDIPEAIIADRKVSPEPPEIHAEDTAETPWLRNGRKFFSSITGLWN